MDRALWHAHLASTSPRYAEWREILGSDDVPLLSPASGVAQLGPEPDEVHLLDVRQMSAAQIDRLIETVAAKFRVDPLDVVSDILRDGTFPIRASDVCVTFDARAFL